MGVTRVCVDAVLPLFRDGEKEVRNARKWGMTTLWFPCLQGNRCQRPEQSKRHIQCTASERKINVIGESGADRRLQWKFYKSSDGGRAVCNGNPTRALA
jgi:hypothetical protein